MKLMLFPKTFVVHDAFDPATKAARPADPQGAVKALTWSLGRLNDPLSAATGTLALADCLPRLGRAAEAERAVQDYFARYPQARGLPGMPERLAPRSDKE